MESTGTTKPAPGKARLGPIGQFAVKALIVAVLALMTSEMIMGMAVAKLDGILRKNMELIRSDVQAVRGVGLSRVMNRLALELEQAAAPNAEIPPEKKQKILSDIRIVVERARPFIVEAFAVLSDGLNAQPTTKK